MPAPILLATPDTAIASQLTLLLRELSYPTETCANPQLLMRRASQLRPQFVLLDREWPGLDGIELQKRLHALLPDCQIALLVESEGSGSLAPFRSGISMMLFRPIETRRTMERLSQWLGIEADAGSGAERRFGSKKPFEAFRKERATRGPFPVQVSAEQPRQTQLPPLGLMPSEESAPLPTGQPSVEALLPTMGGLASAKAAPEPLYRPRFLVGGCRATRLLVRDIWEHRDFERAIVVTGETGCEFELVAREIQNASGHVETMPWYLPPEEVTEERLADLNTQALLSDGDCPVVFLPNIEHLGAGARSALRLFLEGLMEAGNRKHLRLVLGAVLDEASQDADVGPSSLETLVLLCEARLEIPPLRERQPEISALVRRLLVSLITLHPILQVRDIEASAMQRLQSYVWRGNFDQLVNVLRSAVANCPYRMLSMAQLEPLLESDLASFHLLESAADERLLGAS
ncbi:MAG: response regulator [Opitutales bacterium]